MTKGFKITADKIITAGIIAFAVILMTSFLFLKSGKFSSYLFIILTATLYYFQFHYKKLSLSWPKNISIVPIIVFSFIIRIVWVVLNNDFNYFSDWLYYHQNSVSILNGELLFNDWKATGVSILTSVFYLFFGVSH